MDSVTMSMPETRVLACGIEEDESCGWVSTVEEAPKNAVDFLTCPECSNPLVGSEIEVQQNVNQVDDEELQEMVRDQ